MAKLTDDYMPVRIMSFDFYHVVFRTMLGLPMVTDYKVNKKGVVRTAYIKDVYKGSVPASLDSFEIWKKCEKKDPEMAKQKMGGTTLKISHALVNMEFPDDILGCVLSCGELACDPNTKLPQKEQYPEMSVRDYKTLTNAYEGFKTEYENNQDKYKQVKPKTDENEDKTEDKEKKENELTESKDNLKRKFNSLIETYLDYALTPEKDFPTALRFKVREFVYLKGITVSLPDKKEVQKLVHYKCYKRTASKAKQGSCLFIWDKIYEDMLNWTWMDLDYKTSLTDCDLTSAKAYEALLTSSIENKVEIDPEHILLIKSQENPVKSGNRRVMIKDDNGDYILVTPDQYKEKKGKEFEHSNNIWDGQALVDESVFERAGYKKDDAEDNRHGMMLLRNKFFKACAFNTKIKEYFKNEGKDTVTDMFGRKLKADDIEMIVTPDCIKLFKFAGKFFSEESEADLEEAERKENEKRRMYKYWRENLPAEFGIVKSERASYIGHGQYHEVSYQVLNTLPITKEDMKKLLEEDLHYLNLLKNNEALMMYRLRNTSSSVRKRYFFYLMYKYFKEFENTDCFKKFKNEEIQDYKKKLRKGRIKIKGDFYVLCSMPMEMLEYSCNGELKKSYLGPDKAYIQGMSGEEDVVLFRYPHLSAGSVCCLKSTDCEEYDKWFNFQNRDGSNIVVISPWESNIMIKLGGADFDSDTALFVRDKVLQKAAKDLVNITILDPKDDGLPVAQADPDLKTAPEFEYLYREEDMARVDYKLAQTSTTIGSLSNDAQLFNSYFWEGYFAGEEDPRHDVNYLKKIYECIMKLAVLNELEIDRAKHDIKMNCEAERKNIKNTQFNKKTIIETDTIEKDGKNEERYLIPNFLYEAQSKPSGVRRKDDKYWNCPVDYIGKILKEEDTQADDENGKSQESTKTIELDEFLQKVVSESEGKQNNKQLNELKETVIESSRTAEEVDRQISADEKDKANDRDEVQQYVEKIAKKMTINNDTMILLYRCTFEKYKDNSKKGDKKQHKKGDYKCPEIAGDNNIKYRALGYITSIGVNRKEGGLSFLEITKYRRNTLMRKTDKMPKKYKVQVKLFGTEYFIAPDKARDAPD